MANHLALTLIVPTRNRPELARNAIRSVVDQLPEKTRVLVSDNSTLEDAIAELSAFCAELNSSQVQYVRPPQPLSMTRHYDWALTQALLNPATTHVAFLTDRMIFKRGALSEVVEVARSLPAEILTYNHDRIVDHAQPVLLEQNPWSGDVFEMPSQELLKLAARGVFHSCLPRIMNCVVPRDVFELIRARYGNLFDSIAPDFNFCFRTLGLCESITYYDAFPLIHYALDRSNGESQARGIASKDHLDFIANLGGKSFNFAAPVPEFLTVGNAIVHEYCYVRERSATDKFPPVDRRSYFCMINGEIPVLQDLRLREEMNDLLQTSLELEPDGAAIARELYRANEGAPFWRRALRPWKRFFYRQLYTTPWRRFLPQLACLLEAVVTGAMVVKFPARQEALDYGAINKRRRQATTKHLRVLGSAIRTRRPPPLSSRDLVASANLPQTSL